MAPLPAPAGAAVGAELVRLYVQPRFQGQRIGLRLLQAAEQAARAAGLRVVWLTAWHENHRALRFYARQGYQDAGATTYAFQGKQYLNRVLVKALDVGSEAPPQGPPA